MGKNQQDEKDEAKQIEKLKITELTNHPLKEDIRIVFGGPTTEINNKNGKIIFQKEIKNVVGQYTTEIDKLDENIYFKKETNDMTGEEANDEKQVENIAYLSTGVTNEYNEILFPDPDDKVKF